MLIEATTQTTLPPVYTLFGNDDLNVGTGVVLISLTTDAILANTGQHTITVSGTIVAKDDAINTIGCDEAQTIVIASSGVLIAGYDDSVEDADGVILDGVGSTLINNGTIIAHGSGLSLFVRDAGTTTVTNNGLISADKFGVWNKFGLGTLIFTNTGTIESSMAAFFGGDAIDHVTNLGTFVGNVLLNGGSDTYNGLGGTVLGTIDGGGGDDWFVVGNAAETVDGGYGLDKLDFSAVTVALTIDLENAANNRGAPALGDVYTNIEVVIGGSKADVLRGDAMNNQLVGNNGSDRLSGGAGQDVLHGGTGLDMLTGGAGSDVFLFYVMADLRDAITDFTHGEDLIRLSAGGFRLGAYSGGLLSEQFQSSTTNQATEADDRLIFNSTDTTLWYDRDGNGSRFEAMLVVDLQSGATLTAADIDVI